jgi:prevent-host-death family protein
VQAEKGEAGDTIRSVGVRELKNQTSRILQAVREERAEYVITLRGEPVAVLRQYDDQDAIRLQQAELERDLDEMRRLAQQVGEAWTSPKSAVELVEGQRR